MSSPEERFEDEFRKRMQEKFDGFAAPVDKKVHDDVFNAIRPGDRRRYWFLLPVAAAVILGVLLGYWLPAYEKSPGNLSFFKTGKTRQNTRVSAAETAVPIKKHGKTPVKIQDLEPPRNMGISQPDMHLPPGSSRIEEVVLNNIKSRRVESANRKGSNKRVNGPYSPAGSKGEDQWQNNPDASGLTLTPGLPESRHTLPDLLILPETSLAPVFRNPLSLPPVPALPALQSAGTVVRREFHWLFSAAGLQVFQVLHLRSIPGAGFQNIAFAPLLSSRSLGYKIGAGIEKNGFQLLLTYGLLRTWNAYEIGTNRIEVLGNGGGPYHFYREGNTYTKDERLHLVGLALKRSLPLEKTIFRKYHAYAGLEYTRLLQADQNLVWLNFNFAKPVFLTKNARLDIGPYLEYSLTQRTVGQPNWKSRPYQAGISLSVKIH